MLFENIIAARFAAGHAPSSGNSAFAVFASGNWRWMEKSPVS